MNPEIAGRVCDDLDKRLRGAEVNLDGVASLIVAVIRDEAWRRRKIRTGEIVECSSFLELLTAPPLKGYGENPAKVEALLKDDPDALRMFREATVGEKHVHKSDGDNRTITPGRGTSKSYTLDRLHREAPELYQQVVEKKLSANRAAIKAGFRKVKSAGEQLRHWWLKADAKARKDFWDWTCSEGQP